MDRTLMPSTCPSTGRSCCYHGDISVGLRTCSADRTVVVQRVTSVEDQVGIQHVPCFDAGLQAFDHTPRSGRAGAQAFNRTLCSGEVGPGVPCFDAGPQAFRGTPCIGKVGAQACNQALCTGAVRQGRTCFDAGIRSDRRGEHIGRYGPQEDHEGSARMDARHSRRAPRQV